MKDSPPGDYWPFHYRRFFGSARVRELTASQKCLYLAALSLQYEQGTVEGSTRALKVAFAGCYDGDFEDEWAAIVQFFPDGVNPLMEDLRGDIIARSEKARRDGARGGKATARAKAKQPSKGGSSNPSRVAQATRRDEKRREETTEEEKKRDEVATASPARSRSRAVPDTDHAQLIDWWCQTWRDHRLGTEYAVQGGKDGSAVSRLLKKPGADIDEIKRRAVRLLEHPESWMAQHASLAILDSKWNDLAVEIVPKPRNTGTDWDALYAKYGIGGSNGKA